MRRELGEFMNTIIKKVLCVFIFLYTTVSVAQVKFSIVQIPDTQAFMGQPERCSSPTQVNDMLQWIYKDHPNSNYQYIFQVGDIIDVPGFEASPSNEQWNQAKNIAYRSLPTAENPGIPYGFATGNHDYPWPQGSEGYSDYTHLQTLIPANDFLAVMYGGTKHGNSFITDPIFSKKYPDKPYYLISYHQFVVDGLRFVALNLPFGVANSSAAMDEIQKFISATPALFILNIHTPYAIKNQGIGFEPLIKANKKIFMVLYGHDPDVVYNNADFAPAYSTIIKADDPSKGRGNTPAYVYRYDYQQIPRVKDRWGCDDLNNMPQHPLLRVYNFTVNAPNSGDLSWSAKDIQAWTATNPVYNSSKWAWGSAGKPTVATEKEYKLRVGDKIQDQITIRYDDYLN